MPKVIIEPFETFAVVRMQNSITNAISPGFVKELSDTIKEVEKQFQGFVLAGGDKFFSIGFDLPSLLDLDRAGMSEFLADFDNLIFDMFTTPMPTICVMAGHAVGGGCIFALTGDLRYSAAGNKLIGLNEIKLGLPVPYLADLALRQLVGDRTAGAILYGGELISFDDAKHIGLVDEVFPLEELETKAFEKMTTLASLPRSGYSAIKENRVEEIELRFKKNRIRKRELFIHHWFSKPIQELLAEASQKF